MRILSVLALLALGPPLAAQDLFIAGAHLIDPESETVVTGNLLIVDGRIVGRPATPPTGFEGRTIDATGRWLIPGLNDLHTHSYGNMAPGNTFDAPGTEAIAKRVLYAGQTGFLDLFGSEDGLHGLRSRQRSGEAGGADVFASLSCLTATDGHCTEYGVPTRVMDTPEDARRQVGELASKNPDVVKIVYSPTGRMPSIDKATLEAAIAAAAEHGLKTVVHIGSWDAVRDAVEAGASAVTHIPDGPMPDGLAAAMADAGVASIPTLAVELDFGHLVGSGGPLESPIARAVAPPAILDAYRNYDLSGRTAESERHRLEHESVVLAAVKAMADAGVEILAGTDAGNFGTIQGFSIHRELEKLVEAGLSPRQALAAATTRAGAFLGTPRGLGDGDVANLVILDASPLVDIRATQRIFAVIHHGVIVDREAAVAYQSD